MSQSVIKKKMESFMDLPLEVVVDHILPFLSLNDLLRLRTVSRYAKTAADKHLHGTSAAPLFRNHLEITPKLNSFKSFGNLSNLNFAISKIYLKNMNMGHQIFDWDVIGQTNFLQEHGDKITHVKMDEYLIEPSREAIFFFESLPNLKCLEIEDVDAFNQPEEFESKRMRMMELEPIFPTTFSTLKSLKIKRIHLDFGDDAMVRNAKHFFRFCGDHLEYFGFPDIVPVDEPNPDNNVMMLKEVYNSISNRRRDFPDQPNLKFLDLQNCSIKEIGVNRQQARRDSMYLMNLHSVVVHEPGLDTKLMNVNTSLLQYSILRSGMYEAQLIDRAMETSIVSIINLHPNMCYWKFQHLEKIVIDMTSDCFPYLQHTWEEDLYDENGNVPLWPNLKSLEICVDSIELGNWKDTISGGVTTKKLLDLFFVDVRRPSIVELDLGYITYMVDDETPDAQLGYPCPAPEDLWTSCANLTKLRLTNWPGTNEALSKLWTGLQHLEEVHLGHCFDLNDAAFVGDDEKKPTFLSLSRLKTFSLCGLDQMPGITDKAFSCVFRHLRLTHFGLMCCTGKVVKSVTIEGIKSLLTGDFAKSIENFAFDKWSLDGVPDEEFKNLSKQFRSSEMSFAN